MSSNTISSNINYQNFEAIGKFSELTQQSGQYGIILIKIKILLVIVINNQIDLQSKSDAVYQPSIPPPPSAHTPHIGDTVVQI